MTAAAIETRWWHVEGGKVVCTLCPRECHIPEGQRGFCFVRANEGGELKLTTFGRSSGFCVDPIEKKPLNHFLPGTPVLSFGTAGCNLGCKFCQNWDISKSREMDRLADQADPESIVAAAKQAGCRSLAFTYNDPVIWAEYAIEVAKVARAEGIKTVAVTAGYISPEPRVEFYKWMDAANVDLKAFTETFYRKLCQSHLEPVLDTLKYLKRETNVWFELTNLMIPGENDSADETARMCDWIAANLGVDVPVHFTAFHPDFKMLDKTHTPHETLIRAREQALAAGIRYAYTGNVYDVKGQSTYCSGCGAVVIERDWYQLGRWNLKGNQCGRCGHEIAGVFEQGKGDWGRKRVPLTISRAKLAPQASVAVGVAPEPPVNEAPRKQAPRIDFTADEIQTLLAFTRRVVEATVRGEQAPHANELAADLAGAPAYGVFVTLRRATQLRACRGRWGGDEAARLGGLLRSVAIDAATLDPRFPTIDRMELPLLALDISVMFNPQPVTAEGEDRLGAIAVGKHGLVIAHPRGRGLLLPHVPVEGNWNVKEYLDGICRKANLPPDTWRRDRQAKLMTFEARQFTSDAPVVELEPMHLGVTRLQHLVDVVNAGLRDETGNGHDDDLLTEKHVEEIGLFVATATGQTTTAIGAGALLDLAKAAARSLKDHYTKKNAAPEPVTRLTLLWQPIPLRAGDYPQRHRGLGQHAVLARRNGPWSLMVPGQAAAAPSDRVGAVLANLRLSAEDWRASDNLRVTAFSAANFEPRQKPVRSSVRPPARAGQFYPADAAAMHAAVEQYLAMGASEPSPPGRGGRRTYRAVMLPHAGWVFCGETIGRTLARVAVPETVIVISPRHTPYGKAYSVPPHGAWDLPGARIPIAVDLADALLKRVSSLHCDADAHRLEHGVEVLLPFLHRLKPTLRVLPIVLGGMDYHATTPLADALAELCAGMNPAPLLVISSDMNHFAAELENRRRDHLALDAMRGGEPRKLYDTCVENEISMCGLMPACTVMQALLKGSPNLAPELVHYTNSAATSGDHDRVVGYAGLLIA